MLFMLVSFLKKMTSNLTKKGICNRMHFCINLLYILVDMHKCMSWNISYLKGNTFSWCWPCCRAKTLHWFCHYLITLKIKNMLQHRETARACMCMCVWTSCLFHIISQYTDLVWCVVCWQIKQGCPAKENSCRKSHTHFHWLKLFKCL